MQLACLHSASITPRPASRHSLPLRRPQRAQHLPQVLPALPPRSVLPSGGAAPPHGGAAGPGACICTCFMLQAHLQSATLLTGLDCIGRKSRQSYPALLSSTMCRTVYQTLASTALQVLERCGWRVLLRDREELRAAMKELESDCRWKLPSSCCQLGASHHRLSLFLTVPAFARLPAASRGCAATLPTAQRTACCRWAACRLPAAHSHPKLRQQWRAQWRQHRAAA